MLHAIKTIIIVADPSRDIIVGMIRENCLALEIVSVCDTIQTAYASILEHHPLLVFLSAEMADSLGSDLLRLFGELPFKVIIVAPGKKYAVEAFRGCVSDFLQCPLKVEELTLAVNNVQLDLTRRQAFLNSELLIKEKNKNIGKPNKNLCYYEN